MAVRRTPNAVFLTSLKKSKLVKHEAHKMRIPSFGLVDTNSSGFGLTHPLPANDQSVSSVSFFFNLLNKHIIFWKYYVFCKFRYIKFNRYRLRPCFEFNPTRGWARGTWWLWRFTSALFRTRMIRKWQQLKAAERAYRMFYFSKDLINL